MPQGGPHRLCLLSRPTDRRNVKLPIKGTPEENPNRVLRTHAPPPTAPATHRLGKSFSKYISWSWDQVGHCVLLFHRTEVSVNRKDMTE